jgi:ABC-type sugar transport system permease subunit
MKKINKKERERLIFYTSIVLLPVIQFIIFYIVVNFRSIMFAFQAHDFDLGYYFVGFDTFGQTFNALVSDVKVVYGIRNSVILYAATLVVGTGGAIFFSNYIYKKCFGHKFFQIALFLPHIVSGIVLTTIYKYFLSDGVPQIATLFGVKLNPLLSTESADSFYYVLIFQLWMGFGTQVLMYTSTMSGISPEVVESASLDGITPFRELISITLPMIYPTFVTFITVGVAGLFTNQMSLYSFFGDAANEKAYTLGYYLFRQTQWAGAQLPPREDLYPIISALGLIFTFIAVPLTFLVKKLMEKYGPSVE